jgi:hypothetical protein
MALPPSAQTNPAGPALALFRAECFSRRAGLEIDPAQVVEAPWIDWRGVGPERRGPATSS